MRTFYFTSNFFLFLAILGTPHRLGVVLEYVPSLCLYIPITICHWNIESCKGTICCLVIIHLRALDWSDNPWRYAPLYIVNLLLIQRTNTPSNATFIINSYPLPNPLQPPQKFQMQYSCLILDFLSSWKWQTFNLSAKRLWRTLSSSY